MTEDEHQAFANKISERAQEPFEIHMTFEIAVVLIAQIQLALRNPVNTGSLSKVARRFAEQTIERLAGGDEVLRAWLLAGFDPKQDVRV